ncbi:NAD-dependent epimerase/dehydratase family protein [Ornithinimicrobium cavernae]|uniref:NAD-dependent epimerase/dehydratase family protein n=1 Tax=Ornithinimicrobium cavernae TaxID=2666047 RepID=UPI000D695D40|nr:NAD-dependent epimerase/dehydratase family protein [Ornithinimicrobium cavernae]
MAPTALLLGGTGVLRTTAERLAERGGEVTVTARDPARAPAGWATDPTALGTSVAGSVTLALVDRTDPAAVERAVGDGVDLLVDGQGYTPDQATALAALSRRCGTTAYLSAKAVYLDATGRHLNSPEPAHWTGPVGEEGPTMTYAGQAHSSAEGYGANKAESERVLLERGERVTILRPSKIHGPGARQAREWALVRRVLDGREWLPVRRGGAVESTTSAEVLARTLVRCAELPGTRVLNVADVPPRPARELASAVLEAAGRALPQVEVPDEAPDGLGSLPWGKDMVLDTSALAAFGVEAPTFAETVGAEVEWLLAVARERGGTWQVPDWVDGGTVDYAAEDAWLGR